MTDYEELVKALRCETSNGGDCWKKKCQYLVCGSYAYCNGKRIMADAAAAIEVLQAEVQILKVSGREAYFEGLAADAEPKRGEWKPFDLTYGRSIYYCSVCEQATEVPMCMEKPMYAYCPNCGAKMEVQE